MSGSGGTTGGTGQFFLGFGLSLVAVYFLLDSVRASTEMHGVVSGMMRGRGGGGGARMWGTASMGLIFVPFFLGVASLFYNAKMKWAWLLTWVGLGVILVEIFSRIRFHIDVKATYLLGAIAMFAAGVGLMLRSYRDYGDELFAEGPVDQAPNSKAPNTPKTSPHAPHEPPPGHDADAGDY